MEKNREIKFRAWDKESKTMLSWDWVRKCEFPFYSDPGGNNLLNNEVFVLMQFTGLCDKNGTEIYEGDIVKAFCTKSGEKEKKKQYHTCTLYWEMHGYHLTIHHKGEKWATGWSSWTTESEWEVIGNIYETPNLLK